MTSQARDTQNVAMLKDQRNKARSVWTSKTVHAMVFLRAVSWFVTNVLDELRFRFIEYPSSCSTSERILLLSEVCAAMIR